jgi:quinol monooxygenase YgiN
MVIVQGIYRLDPADRDAFVAQSLETMQASRAEKGCLEYVIAADPADPGRAILSERWESNEDLDAHSRALTVRREEAAASGAPAGVTVLSRDFGIYEIASERHIT